MRVRNRSNFFAGLLIGGVVLTQACLAGPKDRVRERSEVRAQAAEQKRAAAENARAEEKALRKQMMEEKRQRREQAIAERKETERQRATEALQKARSGDREGALQIVAKMATDPIQIQEEVFDPATPGLALPDGPKPTGSGTRDLVQTFDVEQLDLEVLRLKMKALEASAGGERDSEAFKAIDKRTRKQLGDGVKRQKHTLAEIVKFFQGIGKDEKMSLEGLAKLDRFLKRIGPLSDPRIHSRAHLLRCQQLLRLGRLGEARRSLGLVERCYRGPHWRRINALCQRCDSLENPTWISGILEEVLLVEDYFEEEVVGLEGFIDLQPVEAVTRVRPGEYARTQFTVINPSPEDVVVVITASSSMVDAGWWRGQWNLDWQPHGLRRPTEREVLLRPYDRVEILLEAALAEPTREQVVTISVAGRTSTWRFSTIDGGAPESELVDASLLERSPFYEVPIFHEIYYRGALEQVANFRVVADRPTELRFFNSETGEILAIDGDGDGSFMEPHDALYHDSDADGHPDFAMGPQRDVGLIEMEAVPLFDDQLRANLSIQIYDAGNWIEDAQDVVVALP